MSALPEKRIVKRGSDGRILSARALEAMGDASRTRHEKARIARASEIAVANTDENDSQFKSIALVAFPGVLDRWIRGALGRIKGWPASAQLEAGKLVAGVAGIALESRANGSGPLSEMSLVELEATLSASLDSTRNLIAIEGQAAQVHDSIQSDSPVIGDSVPPEASEPTAVPGDELPPDDAPT